ncbi:indolepyruvate ferredoxin oxidoreductase family protein [Massilia sp. NR 4-1]|uniref:indolepyruvate ferredoxin oxidoreductase family protein n=1 Tax=Massilia sp. NR 4-1 TaxID=1678028 RepID=UPI00067E3860|nr:indolepyruvate ferredoxin oxidoreductase family protein [Massilia sp. NR 4-1]AKU21013.1 2-oxoacid ferredoxin oxidoreductase [Massilia sp. NR 4-1]
MKGPASELEARYRRGISEAAGPALLSGTQALVRMLLAQAEKDRRDGLATAGFVSGYRGSPLGGVDQELWRAGALLKAADVHFTPAINEDLAATAIIGTQKVASDPERLHDGVFAMWYGKGPGVDRSGDALKHGNYYGSSPHGGVLVVAGDDHGCVSSSMSHQSDMALMAWGMPVIHPASVDDYVRFGLWGWALSRCSGLWVGFKAISETVESSVSMAGPQLDEIEACRFAAPEAKPGPDGLHWRWPDLPGPQLEQRMRHKRAAAIEFATRNPLDQLLAPVSQPRLLIAAVGKAYGDVMEALRLAGLPLRKLAEHGVAIAKIGLVSPLSPQLQQWARAAVEVFVVEEKAAVVEGLLKDSLYNLPLLERPQIIGKYDEKHDPLLPDDVELNPELLRTALARLLGRLGVPLAAALRPQLHIVESGLPKRTPYFCSGCPHNTSTQLPAGSRAQLGIGCHALAAQIPERNTSGSVQMGGEGVDWIGHSPFVSGAHIFQNLGDGTFFHSGQLAIRQAVAAGVNITYKILYNDAVAMTGGQPVDGSLSVAQLTRLVAAEGVKHIYLMSPAPQLYRLDQGYAADVQVRHRDQLDAVQRELRELPGVSVLIYDQVCAMEERRRRKKARPAPARVKMLINEQVCEGCGDCQKKSNCMAIVPQETAFGRKRKIDQESCNSDLSCLRGFCPSFVSIRNAVEAPPPAPALAPRILELAGTLARPETSIGDAPYEILVAGVGGTGVVTIGGLIALAAHIQGIGVRSLNFTGFSQKGGAVRSHVRLARDRDTLYQARVGHGRADALIAADLLVAASQETLGVIQSGRTRIVANLQELQIGAMLRDEAKRIDIEHLRAILQRQAGGVPLQALQAHRLAARTVGVKYVNVLLFGYAWQQGLVPLACEAILAAIQQHGVEAASNALAFACGRLAAAAPEALEQLLSPDAPSAPATGSAVERYAAYLEAYQDAAYAQRFRAWVERAAQAGQRLGSDLLAPAVAENLFKLLAYKDEYEVARLLSSAAFRDDIRRQFGPRAQAVLHLRPPLLPERWRRHEQPRTIAFGAWVFPMLRLLSGMRRWRGSWADPFRYLRDHRAEREWQQDYLRLLAQLLERTTAATLPRALELIALPQLVRGYGPVRRQALAQARQRRLTLLAQYEAPETPPAKIIPIKTATPRQSP